MSKIAMMPGSYDPFTLGHLDTVKQALRVVDEVVIAVMTNTSKTSLFTPEERVALITTATADLAGVRVVAQPEMLAVEYARQIGATVLARGLRNSADYAAEVAIAAANARLAPEVTTIFFQSRPEFVGVASSLVKEIAYFGGDLTGFVPGSIAAAITHKMR